MKLFTRSDDNNKKKSEKNIDEKELIVSIIEGLGGKENISEVDCCATRLRVTLYNTDAIQEDILKSTDAAGLIYKSNGVQIIYGLRVAEIKSNLEDYLAKE